MGKKKWIVGNWKMNNNLSRSAVFFDYIHHMETKEPDIFSSLNIGLCLPNVFLPFASSHIASRFVQFGVQDISAHISGAFTGEVSAAMVAEFGAKITLVGHSERRQYHAESNELVAYKAQKALDCRLTPLVCVGETLEDRQNGITDEVIIRQIKPLFDISITQLSQIIIAYEPVWAIGTGISASAEEAQTVHYTIRKLLEEHNLLLREIPLLYGGSMNARNAVSLLSQADIDGGLIGGASLDPETFFDVIRQAKI